MTPVVVALLLVLVGAALYFLYKKYRGCSPCGALNPAAKNYADGKDPDGNPLQSPPLPKSAITPPDLSDPSQWSVSDITFILQPGSTVDGADMSWLLQWTPPQPPPFGVFQYCWSLKGPGGCKKSGQTKLGVHDVTIGTEASSTPNSSVSSVGATTLLQPSSKYEVTVKMLGADGQSVENTQEGHLNFHTPPPLKVERVRYTNQDDLNAFTFSFICPNLAHYSYLFFLPATCSDISQFGIFPHVVLYDAEGSEWLLQGSCAFNAQGAPGAGPLCTFMHPTIRPAPGQKSVLQSPIPTNGRLRGYVKVGSVIQPIQDAEPMVFE